MLLVFYKLEEIFIGLDDTVVEYFLMLANQEGMLQKEGKLIDDVGKKVEGCRQ